MEGDGRHFKERQKLTSYKSLCQNPNYNLNYNLTTTQPTKTQQPTLALQHETTITTINNINNNNNNNNNNLQNQRQHCAQHHRHHHN